MNRALLLVLALALGCAPAPEANEQTHAVVRVTPYVTKVVDTLPSGTVVVCYTFWSDGISCVTDPATIPAE